MKRFFSRLQFLDKIGYDRAWSDFKIEANSKSIDESEYLLSLLDSGEDYETSTVKNAINFAVSFAEFGTRPSQQLLTRILFLCFLKSSFVMQLSILSNLIDTRGWIFHGLSKILALHNEKVKESIIKDDSIWDLIIKYFWEDIQNKEIDYTSRYSERGFAYLIEVLPLFWPYESPNYVKIEELTNEFCLFCLNCRSKVALELLSLLSFVFPTEVAESCKNNIHIFTPIAMFHLLKLRKIKIPGTEVNSGAIIAAKALEFNPNACMCVAKSDENTPERKDIIEMISKFDIETHSFNFDLDLE